MDFFQQHIMISTERLSIGHYILERLKEIGIDTVFGVPGDFNLNFLDQIEDDKSLIWGRNVNELNAAYAADGYARVKGAGAILTTFGVGELSAVNGIAGSYAEQVPVIHLVGMPKTTTVDQGAKLHHTFCDGNFSRFSDIYSQITVASECLSVNNAAQQIDRVITQSMLHHRPGYIGIPCDIVDLEIMAPKKKLDYALPKNPSDRQEAALKAITDAICQAKHAIILVDGCAARNDVKKTVNELVEISGFPVYAAPKGLDVVDHTHPSYRGCYCGDLSFMQVKEEVNGADLVLQIGLDPVDTNTGGFTSIIDASKVIAFHTTTTKVFHSSFDKVSMQELLPILIQRFPTQKEKQNGGAARPPVLRRYTPSTGTRLTQDYFWHKIAAYVPEHAIIVTETGTPTLGTFNLRFPKGCRMITQMKWGSIGYAVPATLGAAMADRSKPVILMVGDGSFQVSAQEVSLMLHHGIRPIILVFNNDGYLIEKLIHGDGRKYNDIQRWDYADTLRYMGADIKVNNARATTPVQVGIHEKIETTSGFQSAIEKAVAQPDRIHLLELVFNPDDAPEDVLLLATSYKQ